MPWKPVPAEASAAWLLSQLAPVRNARDTDWSGNRIDCCLPPGYPVYVKVFHAIHEDLTISDHEPTWDDWQRENAPPLAESDAVGKLLASGTLIRGAPDNDYQARRVFWSALAERYGLTFHPEINQQSFGRRFRKRSWPRYLVGPEEGTLTDAEFTALLACILAACPNEPVNMYWELAQFTRGQEPLCIRGKLGEPIDAWPDGLDSSPEYIWPESREWVIHTDYDSTFTLVAATEALAHQLTSNDVLESLVVPSDIRIDWQSDAVNR